MVSIEIIQNPILPIMQVLIILVCLTALTFIAVVLLCGFGEEELEEL